MTFKRLQSFFSSRENEPNMMKCVAHNDSELIRCYTLDCAVITILLGKASQGKASLFI